MGFRTRGAVALLVAELEWCYSQLSLLKWSFPFSMSLSHQQNQLFDGRCHILYRPVGQMPKNQCSFVVVGLILSDLKIVEPGTGG